MVRLSKWMWWAGLSCALACEPAPQDPVSEHTPVADTHDDSFASSASCRSCHPAEYASWSETYHRTMTQRASPESVLGTWDNILLERDGREYVLYREDDGYWVDMPKPGTTGERDVDRMQRPIVMTTGSHHLQLYWMVMPWLDTEPAPAGRAVFTRHCAACHVVPGEEPAEGNRRTYLDNRKLTRPWLRAFLTSQPAEGPHQAVLGSLRPSETADLLDFVVRLQHGDRLAQFPFGWFIREQRWVHEDDSFLSPPEDPLDHETITEGWSRGCDRCHAVGADFAEDLAAQTGAASAVDLGIACEACHGRGAQHTARYRDPLSRYASHLGLPTEDDIVVPSALSAERSAQVCGQCHAEVVPKDRDVFPLNFQPGDDLFEVAYLLQRTEERPRWLVDHLRDEPDAIESGFWEDGTIRIAGRDYTGLLETPCHTDGDLACTTCHQLHGADPNDQLKSGATGDSRAGEQVCVDCHPGHDSVDHTHHPVDSTGARCMNCHMPRTTIGLLTVMRAHRIDSPSPARAGHTGRPDACSLCHLDKPLAWSAAKATEWYGQPPLSLGLSSPAPAAFDWLLRGDAAQRAVVAWHMGAPDTATGTDWTPAYLAWSLDDPYVAVRSIVRQRLRSIDGYSDLDWDPARSPEALEPIRNTVLQRWQSLNPGLDRPDVWIQSGIVNEEKVQQWRYLRDESPVSVNE